MQKKLKYHLVFAGLLLSNLSVGLVHPVGYVSTAVGANLAKLKVAEKRHYVFYNQDYYNHHSYTNLFAGGINAKLIIGLGWQINRILLGLEWGRSFNKTSNLVAEDEGGTFTDGDDVPQSFWQTIKRRNFVAQGGWDLLARINYFWLNNNFFSIKFGISRSPIKVTRLEHFSQHDIIATDDQVNRVRDLSALKLQPHERSDENLYGYQLGLGYGTKVYRYWLIELLASYVRYRSIKPSFLQYNDSPESNLVKYVFEKISFNLEILRLF